MATPHSALLYSLRSSVSISEKLSIAQLANQTNPSPILSQVIRDWILESFLRSIKGGESLLGEIKWWTLLSEVVVDAIGNAITPVGPIFNAFFGLYPSLGSSAELLQKIIICWKKLGSAGMRKGTLDLALEGFSIILKSSVIVLGRASLDREDWQDLVESWSRAFVVIADAGKTGKKIPSATLSLLPSLLATLSHLSPQSSLHSHILSTLQLCFFNVDNLRRGIARETYNAGGTSTIEDVSNDSAEGELLNALKKVMLESTGLKSSVLSALPYLLKLYRTSLATHSSVLFPLPARTSFPTASAARSASEIFELSKQRSLVGGWVKGVCSLIDWSQVKDGNGETAKCLWRTFEEIEQGDLYREGRGVGWEGILESIVEGAVARLALDGPERFNSMGLLATTMRLSFEIVAPALPAILLSLASTSTTSSTSSEFLTALLIHHSRSLLLPRLINLLSDAQASPTASPNNLLDSFGWKAELGQALVSLVGTSVAATWTQMTEKLVEREDIEMDLGEGSEAIPGSVVRTASEQESVAARIRMLALFIKSIPSPIPYDRFTAFLTEQVNPALASLFKSQETIIGVAMLEARYTMIERLRLEGLLETEEWKFDNYLSGSLTYLNNHSGPGAIEMTRSILQSLSSETNVDSREQSLSAIVNLLNHNVLAKSWKGHLQAIEIDCVHIALWELITRRWLPIIEQYATNAQLDQIAGLIIARMAIDTDESNGITVAGITNRLLQRADFYELRRIQAHFQLSLLSNVTVESLSPSAAVLATVSSEKKLSKNLRAIKASGIQGILSTFSRISSLVPVDYLGKSLRNDLIERALGLDIFISARKVDTLTELEISAGQVILRQFVGLVRGNGGSVNEGSAVLAYILKHTFEPSSELAEATISLYQTFIHSAISNLKSSPTKDFSTILSFINGFSKPLADLAKRSKSVGSEKIVVMTPEELAFCTLCETIVTGLPDSSTIAPELLEAIKSISKSSTKYLLKTLAATSLTLEANASATAILECADLISASCQIWKLHDWLQVEPSVEGEQEIELANFCQLTLSHLLKLFSATTTIDHPQALKTCLTMLNLLSFRINQLRIVGKGKILSTLPFETFLACHLKFRAGLKLSTEASIALNENFRKSTATSSIAEYTIALDDIAEAVATSVVEGNDDLEFSLDVALVLIRDGPEGSSRLSSGAVSKILQHLSYFLVRQQAGFLDEVLASKYLVIGKFLEGICSDRPMLLSRQNVSSIFALVSQILLPSGTTFSQSSAVSVAIASNLFLTLVSITSHLVRHRKDHITPLFPALISILSAFLSCLRRAGFDTTGSSSTAFDEEVNFGVTLGKRAERESKSTFAFWVWEGGIKAIGKPEAKAVGRLLASLTTKTTTNLKRKRDVSTIETTSSLAAPLSKHSPFLLLTYLRYCVHVVSPIPSTLRAELQGGWFEILDVMGKFEREALMKGFLSQDDEAERGVLRGMWRAHEKERYRG